MYINGNDTTVAAITVAGQEKTALTPMVHNTLPNGPCLPKKSNSKNPTTVGGSTSGKMKKPSKTAYTTPDRRSRHPASAVPQTQVIKVAVRLVATESQTGERESLMTMGAIIAYCSDHSLLVPAASQGESVLFKNRACFRAREEILKSFRRVGMLATFQHCCGVNNRLMSVLRHVNGNARRFRSHGICAIHESRVRISRFHISQHLAHVFRVHNLLFQFVEQLLVLQCLLRVHPRRNCRKLSHSHLAHLGLVQIFQGMNRSGRRRNHHNQLVSHHIFSSAIDQQIFLLQFVHLLFSGRKENVNRCSLCDLVLQRT